MQLLTGDARSLVLGGRATFALILPGQPSPSRDSPLDVRLITNPARVDSIVATGRVVDLLNTYQREMLGSRLRAANTMPQATKAKAVIRYVRMRDTAAQSAKPPWCPYTKGS